MPGDTIEYHVTKMARQKNMWWFRGEAKVAGQIVAEAEVGAMIADELDDVGNRPHRPRSIQRRVIGQDVTIGPYCMVGPNVVDRRRRAGSSPMCI